MFPLVYSLYVAKLVAGHDPKGYNSEKFLLEKVFILKGHYKYSEKFYLEELLFRKVFIPKGLYSKIQNNDSSELKSSE